METVRAIANFQNPSHGVVLFEENIHGVSIDIDLYNLVPGLHGFHIHIYGDNRNGCESMGPHFNPMNGTHKGRNVEGNHWGDLGNILVGQNGQCRMKFNARHLSITGIYGIVGRGLVIHRDTDDEGMGNNFESRETGNSGPRIACAIIALCK